MSGVRPGENLDVALSAAMAVQPGVGLLSLVWLVGLYAPAVGVALIVLALRLRGGPPAYRRIWIRRRIGGTL